MLPAFSGIARAQEPARDAATLIDMSVGFVEGSESWPTFEKLSLTALSRGHRAAAGAPPTVHSVVPAAEMIAGDQQLASELVRVGVRGLYPVLTSSLIEEVRLTVLFPSPDPARQRALPFHAWSYKARPAPNPSPPLRFVAPLDIDGGFRLRLDVVPATPGRTLTRRSVAELTTQLPGGAFVTDFTVDWYEGRPKLQRGVYLLGLAPGTWRTQRNLPVHRTGRQRPLELLSLILTIEPAPAVD
jgi:hypothetical protein